jgi:hypothetical protein
MSERATNYLVGKAIETGIDRLLYDDHIPEPDPDPHNPDTFQHMDKTLGLFKVSLILSREQILDQDGIEIVPQGQLVWWLALPPVSTKKRRFTEVDRSLSLLSSYMLKHDPRFSAKYAISETYEGLADVSKRWGFRISRTQIPKRYQSPAKKEYREYQNKGYRNAGKGRLGLVIYQSSKDLINRFGPPSQEE